MRLPRWLHRLYARAFGYFWLPCPRCGREFGGHEVLRGEVLPWVGPGHRWTQCPACTRMEAIQNAIATGHQFGYDISRATRYRSGVMYPLLARLECTGVIVSDLEPDPGDRPPRRRYRLADGVGGP